ncbi:MAG: tRNA lysidine(34) synthetase TilS [Mycobacteriaceae bacterium]|nr:tRNA lysidine(34) synthetase TilS [Corynebacterium glucuronolyticum]MDD7587303.1 tRNA lysidine(34) synthetase TilS [Mycobacteriaceae bacterium]
MRVRNAVRRLHCHDVAVGLSGGPDSLALTAALVAEGVHVTALCVDHGLQDGSREVSEEAARIARSWGADAEVIPVTVTPHTEAAARKARYRAFAEWGGTVCVAHTMDDLAETFLIAGLRGMTAGMQETAEIEGAQIIRPLLAVRRADTVATCQEIGVTPWSDPQNDDPAFTRVRVRKEVLPLLGDIVGGDAVPALARAARRTQAEATRMTATTVPLATKDLPEATRHDIIAGALRAAGAKVSKPHLEGVDKLLTQWHGQGPRDVGGGLVALRISDAINIEEKESNE